MQTYNYEKKLKKLIKLKKSRAKKYFFLMIMYKDNITFDEAKKKSYDIFNNHWNRELTEFEEILFYNLKIAEELPKDKFEKLLSLLTYTLNFNLNCFIQQNRTIMKIEKYKLY